MPLHASVIRSEIMSLIIDYLAIPDQLATAQTARRMREMVYDDTRWVKKLRSMNVWNENEARKEAKTRTARPTACHDRNTSTSNAIASSVVSAAWREQDAIGMGASTVSTTIQPEVGDLNAEASIAVDALSVMSRSRSVRGFARQEYGKIYAALNLYYVDILANCACNGNILPNPPKEYMDQIKVIHSQAKLFRVYNTPEEQAQMLSQLYRFAKSDISLGGFNRMATLDLAIAAYENTALIRFKQSMEANDINNGMKKYAHVLVTLNGGDLAIDSFIKQSPVLLDRLAFGNPSKCFKDSIAAVQGISLQPVQDFFRRISVNILEQLEIANRVFPFNKVDSVIQKFLICAANKTLAAYISTLLKAAQERSREAFVKAVPALFEHCLRLVEVVLLQYRQTQGQSCHSSTAQRVFEVLVVNIFEPYVELYFQKELDFFLHRAEIEVSAWEKQLSEKQASAESFFLSNVNRQAAKKDFLSSFRKAFMMPINVISSAPQAMNSKSSSKSVPADIDTRPSNLRSNTSNPPNRIDNLCPQELPTTELAAKAAIMNSRLEGISSLFSIDLALNTVHCAKASIDRMAAFVRIGGSMSNMARVQCEAVFVQLLKTLGSGHIKSGFDRAVAHLGEYKPRPVEKVIGSGNRGNLKASNMVLDGNLAIDGAHRDKNNDIKNACVTPLVTFLELVNVGDLIQQMLDVFYSQELVATRLIDRDDFLNAATKEKKRFEQMLDERVAAGLNKGIDTLMAQAEMIFATTQQPSDYNPNTVAKIVRGNADGAINSAATAKDCMNTHAEVIDIGPTQTARTVVALISSHTNMLVGSTERTMLDVFNQEVGLRLFGQLCKHIKRQRISKDGAVKLIRYALFYSFSSFLANFVHSVACLILQQANLYLLSIVLFPSFLMPTLSIHSFFTFGI